MNAEGPLPTRTVYGVPGFNGAAFDERGRLAGSSIEPKSAELQWGRARMSAEGWTSRRCGSQMRAWLQWGRVRMSAEGRSMHIVHQLGEHRFNGAAFG